MEDTDAKEEIEHADSDQDFQSGVLAQVGHLAQLEPLVD